MAKKQSNKAIPLKKKEKERALLPLLKALAQTVQSIEIRVQELEERVRIIEEPLN